jgi:hypothetical protein
MEVLESTANGMGGYFYNVYRYARRAPFDADKPYLEIPEPTEDEWNGFYRVFNPWYIDPEYRRTPPADFTRTVSEKSLAVRHKLDDGQLYWRRRTILEKCNGDEDLFKQEYPSDDRECFLLSGRPVFDPQAVEWQRKNVRPCLTGEMQWVDVTDPDDDDVEPDMQAQFVEGAGAGYVQLWERPSEREIYSIGADTAEGLDPTETNDTDLHSAYVINNKTKAICAKISGRFDPDMFGEQLDLLGRYYNCALLGFEVNNTSGGSVRTTLKRTSYPNLFYRERWDKDLDEMTLQIGWYTTKDNRKSMIMDMQVAVRERQLGIQDVQTIHQLGVFVWGKDGKPQASTGEHDDDVIALCITWQMMLASVVTGALEVEDSTGEDVADSRPNFTSDMIAGGIEPPVEYEDEDDDDYY